MRSILLPMLCLMVGCSPGPERVPVTGSVMYKGKPLEYGSVMFQPVGAEGGAPARSSIAADGTFALSTEKEGDGVLLGKSRVRVTAFARQRDGDAAVQAGEPVLGRSAIPTRFGSFGASGIEIDVTRDMELPITIDLDEFK